MLVLLGISTVTFGQSTQRTVGGYTVFTIPFEGDSITFAVVADKNESRKSKSLRVTVEKEYFQWLKEH